eukprot:m.747038 g.747038  ORF g.747038 m.747038 type:complete len:519 (-) comp23143_c0_seq1:1627-3183(-)
MIMTLFLRHNFLPTICLSSTGSEILGIVCARINICVTRVYSSVPQNMGEFKSTTSRISASFQSARNRVSRSKSWKIFARLSDISMMVKSLLAGVAVVSILQSKQNSRCENTAVRSCITNESLAGQPHQFDQCYTTGTETSQAFGDLDDDVDSFGGSALYQFNSTSGLQCSILSASSAAEFCQPIDTTTTPKAMFLVLLVVNQVLFIIAIGWRVWFTTKPMNSSVSACLIAVAILITIGKIVAVFHLVVSTSSYACQDVHVSSPQGQQFDNNSRDVLPMTFSSCTSSGGVFDLKNIHPDCTVSPNFGRCSRFQECNNASTSQYIKAQGCENAFAPDCKLSYACNCNFSLPNSVYALVGGVHHVSAISISDVSPAGVWGTTTFKANTLNSSSRCGLRQVDHIHGSSSRPFSRPRLDGFKFFHRVLQQRIFQWTRICSRQHVAISLFTDGQSGHGILLTYCVLCFSIVCTYFCRRHRSLCWKNSHQSHLLVATWRGIAGIRVGTVFLIAGSACASSLPVQW